MRPFFARALTLGCLAVPAMAFEPELPLGARLTAERNSAIDRFEVPLDVFDGAHVPTVTMEGAITRQAWRVDARGLTPLQIILPLRDQLVTAGYDLAFECDAAACGGFDFRFGVEVLPGPNMYVNITRFYALTALRGHAHAPAEAVTILASSTGEAAYVQIITAKTEFDRDAVVPVTGFLDANEETKTPEVPTIAPDSMADHLTSNGRVVLSDLEFAPGTSDLGPGPFASLTTLAGLLEAQPQLRIVLVGHTDTTGDLATNIAVSRARAQSVQDRLVAQYNVDETRLDAQGMGYLAPVTSNLTEDGRHKNRRVEAVLLNVQ